MRLILLLFVSLYLSCLGAPLPAQEQAGYLQAVLRQADDAYYNRGKSIMGDAAYDALRAQYERLLVRYPEIGDASGVGAPVNGSSRKHSSSVLSLKKAYSDEEVKTFVAKCGADQLFCVEPKIDGLTLVLRYHDGLLVGASTRGDGKSGFDVTAAVLASGAVPAEVAGKVGSIEVRGELYMPHGAFAALNQRRSEAGEALLKSPRNTAAGTMRLLDFGEVARRGLEFRAFELRAAEPMLPTHTEALAWIRNAGLYVVESRAVSASEVLSEVEALNRRRANFPFATDGIVIRLNDQAAFDALGATARYPRGALARKYKEVPVETRLLSVEWKRGEKGRLTPVAILEPVELQGATVRRASLHSLPHLRALDLRLGDWVKAVRAGGAVPEIIGVDISRRTGAEKPIPDPVDL